MLGKKDRVYIKFLIVYYNYYVWEKMYVFNYISMIINYFREFICNKI